MVHFQQIKRNLCFVLTIALDIVTVSIELLFFFPHVSTFWTMTLSLSDFVSFLVA